MKRLAIVTTHPIQYNAPLFAALARTGRVHPKAFYTWSQTQQGGQFDPDFRRPVAWDVPLLDGYDHTFIENTARRPGSNHFMGIVNPGLVGALEAWHPDAILVCSWPLHSHLAVLRHFHRRVPLLFRGDSTLLNERPGWRTVARRALLTWVYHHVDIALPVGLRNRDYFEAHGLRDEQLVHVPHCVDNARFANPGGQPAEEARAWRRKLGIDDRDRVLLFVGKLESVKDPHWLVRLAQRLPSSRLKFVFVGEGHLEESLRRDVGGDPRVLFLGFQNQRAMPIVYRLGDLLVLPSRSETWGLALNEAMACGRPILVSDRVGAAPDLVDEGRTGWSFAAGGAGDERVARLLEEVLADRIDLTKMGAAAAARITDFSVEAAADAIARTLERGAVEGGRSGAPGT
ncbi:MAG: glycosyltransferase family 4 protein [Deltaproteobacteria bacterium]|nr:glycosyltransferase family 4 protein [Deltaproteobacteria bacterium]